MVENNLFGKRLLELREAKGFSLEDVAKMIGKDKSMLSKYERGIVEPGMGVAKKLADFFNVSIDYLCGISDNKYSIYTIRNEFNELTDDQREEVLKYIRYLKNKPQI